MEFSPRGKAETRIKGLKGRLGKERIKGSLIIWKLIELFFLDSLQEDQTHPSILAILLS